MRLGLPEIAIILIVLVVIVVSARIFRANPGSTQQDRDTSAETAIQQAKKKPSKIRRYLRRTGIALVLVGAIFLFAAIGMFRWAFQSYMWSFLLVVIGFAIVFLSRKK